MLFAKTSTLQRTLFSTMKDAITWKLNKQPITASSSTTAEHIALNEVTRESMVLSQILTSMGTPLRGPVPIYTDSANAMKTGKLSGTAW